MTKLALSVVAVVAVMAAAFAPSLRAQSKPRFEYVRVTAHIVIVNTGPQSVRETVGYRACLAASTEWKCRTFEAPENGEALRTALATLGDEGWELVSAVEEIRGGAHPVGLTYLFKRPL